MKERSEMVEIATAIVSVVVICIVGIYISSQVYQATPPMQYSVTKSVVNETFNSSEYDTWVQLAHTNIVNASETVTDLSGATTYSRGTDYQMNYTDGKIMVLSTGSMSNYTDYLISYQYITKETSPFSTAMSSATNIMNVTIPLLVVVAIAIIAGVIMREILIGFGGGKKE
ncbi:MAG: hypothetical protein EJNHJLOP_00034 [Methanophagales virus PBV082]|uniref:Uncharacterized protein n=1 Tax=Methanophagales virus PBV082 TaxID=3071307 RepID=A0AA46YIS9_9VIRU|nr:MAG: hypothetical protein QIT52_gp34 [Methanophagales virus PBV082]UYL64923.1 MAG: hypothetical protein EJNHJLOP_00034 [Methanophagales virus PBV082]